VIKIKKHKAHQLSMRKIDKKVAERILEEYSEDNKNPMSYTKLGEELSIDRHIISDYCKSGVICEDVNGNYYAYNESFKEIEEAFNLFYETKCPYAEIYEKYHIKRETFKKYCKEIFGLDPTEYKHIYDIYKFDKIDTEEKAYWLGFLNADGCLQYDSKRNAWKLSLKLGDVDKYHVYDFAKFMELDDYENRIDCEIHNKTHNKLWRVAFYGEHLANSLLSYGLKPNKSTKEVPYYDINPELKRHYMRGLVDGDGYIKGNLTNVGLCGSLELCTWFQNELLKDLNLEKTTEVKLSDPKKHNNLYKICFYKDRQAVLEYLYKDSTVYLKRKYELANKICNFD
jgi:hypothetical protein